MRRMRLLVLMMMAILAGVLLSLAKQLTIQSKEGEKIRVVNSPVNSIDSITFIEAVKENVKLDTDTLKLDATEVKPQLELFPDIESEKADGKEYSKIKIFLKDGRVFQRELDSLESFDFQEGLASIYLTTDSLQPIKSKIDYVGAEIRIDAEGVYADYDYPLEETRVNVRGRGNTTWWYPKRPYRLKFDKKISLFGMKKAKSYCLIADYRDDVLMKNALAFKIAQSMGMDVVNHCIPIKLFLNNKYEGLYFITEKIGMNAGSVDISDATGVVMELDEYFDEEFKFRSAITSSPVMIKDPDLNEIFSNDTTKLPEMELSKWQDDFNNMESELLRGNIDSVIDLESAVNYMLTFHVLMNRELNGPKSAYMYKEHIDSVYKLGPVWDFDWSMNNNGNPPTIPYFVGTSPNIYRAIAQDSVFLEMFSNKWEYFKSDVYPQLQMYIEEYASIIRNAAYENGERWPIEKYTQPYKVSTETFDKNVERLKSWLDERIKFIDESEYFGLFTSKIEFEIPDIGPEPEPDPGLDPEPNSNPGDTSQPETNLDLGAGESISANQSQETDSK